MKTNIKFVNKYCNFRFWKNLFIAIINYSPVTIVDYIYFFVRSGIFACACITFLNIKNINGVLTLKHNRKLIRTIVIITGNIYF